VVSKRGEKIIEENEPSYYYRIAPLILANEGRKPQPAVMKHIIGYCLKPKGTVFELKRDEYEKIKSFLLRQNKAKKQK